MSPSTVGTREKIVSVRTVETWGAGGPWIDFRGSVILDEVRGGEEI